MTTPHTTSTTTAAPQNAGTLVGDAAKVCSAATHCASGTAGMIEMADRVLALRDAATEVTRNVTNAAAHAISSIIPDVRVKAPVNER